MKRRLSRRRVVQGLAAVPLLGLVGCGDDDDGGSNTSPTPPASATRSADPTAELTSESTPSPSAEAATAAASPGPYVPPSTGEWEQIPPEEAGFTASGIEDLISVVEANRSATLMVLSGGRILTENYFGAATASRVQDVASVQKSVISTLIGIARERGLLTLDDAISDYLPSGWSNGESEHEAAITIRDLMTHSSGLNPRTLQSVALPGRRFDYNTAAYQRLRPLLEVAADQDINTITRSWIFDKIGPAEATTWQPRMDENDSGSAPAWGLLMNAREMARFGLLTLRRGQWAGTSVVSESWFDEAWTPSSVKADYGLLWWLMGRGRVRGPGVPEDWVAALGARDQKIYVFPSFDLVLTRQGFAAQEETENVSNFDKVLFNAIVAARA